MRSSPRLLGIPERPFLAELFGHLRVRDDVAGSGINASPLDRLNDVEMVEDILQAGVVGKAVEKLSDGLLGFQLNTP